MKDKAAATKPLSHARDLSRPGFYVKLVLMAIVNAFGVFGILASYAKGEWPLLAFLVVRALLVGLGCEDPFGRLVAVGVGSWFAFQVFENVGMNLGLMPVTGLPLPFLSYGGSSMLACWLAVGLVVSAQRGTDAWSPGPDLRGSGHVQAGRWSH